MSKEVQRRQPELPSDVSNRREEKNMTNLGAYQGRIEKSLERRRRKESREFTGEGSQPYFAKKNAGREKISK